MTIPSIPLWRLKDEINVGFRLIADVIEGCVYSALIGGFTVVSALMCRAPAEALWTWFWIGFALSMTVCSGLWLHQRRA